MAGGWWLTDFVRHNFAFHRYVWESHRCSTNSVSIINRKADGMKQKGVFKVEVFIHMKYNTNTTMYSQRVWFKKAKLNSMLLKTYLDLSRIYRLFFLICSRLQNSEEQKLPLILLKLFAVQTVQYE